MAGKMTVLDRLMQQGRIKPRLDETMWSHADFRDPLNYTFAGRQYIKAHPESFPRLDMTPERIKYQRGLANIRANDLSNAEDSYRDAAGELEDLQSQFEEDYSDAWESMHDDIFSDKKMAPELSRGFGEDDLNLGRLNIDLSEYWPPYTYSPDEYGRRAEDLVDAARLASSRSAYLESPEYIQRLQTRSPRYRNYQRAMQQRAANKAVGRDLSRRYATAVRNLVRRGLSPEEADAYVRQYFGGR